MSLVPMPPYPWLDAVWSSFVERFEQQRMPHALLVTGPDGLGALPLAQAFAQLLLCRSPLDGIACNKCRACQLQAAGTHPDLMLVMPEEKSTQIKVDQVRALTLFLSQTAQQGGKKVVILSPIDKLNHNAANALLKSLEEPAGDTILILLTSKESMVIPTIKSRCARVVLHAPATETALNWLNERNPGEYVALLKAAFEAPLRVLELIDQGYAQQCQSMQTALLDIAYKAVGPVRAANGLHGITELDLLEYILSLVDDLITLCSAPEHDRALAILASADDTLRPFLESNMSASTLRLYKYRDRLCEQKQSMTLNSNLNSTLFIEQLLMDWSAMMGARNRR